MEIPTFHRQIMRVKNTETTPCVIVETMVCQWQLVPAHIAHIALSYYHPYTIHQHFYSCVSTVRTCIHSDKALYWGLNEGIIIGK